MALKKKIAAMLIALSAVSAISVTASAVGPTPFVMRLNAGTTMVTGVTKKTDNIYALVKTQDGIYNCYVSYSVRTSNGKSNASYSIRQYDLDKYERMYYRSGYGYKDNYYTLSALLPTGQRITTTTVSGSWWP